MDETTMSALVQLIWGLVTLLGLIGTAVGAISTVKNLKRSSDKNVEQNATEKAHMARDISEIKDKVQGIDAKMEVYSKEQGKLFIRLAVVERDINTAFPKIDEVKKQN